MTVKSEPNALHFLDRLAGRIKGSLEVLEPRRPTTFEPREDQPEFHDVASSDQLTEKNSFLDRTVPRSVQTHEVLSGQTSRQLSLSVSPKLVSPDSTSMRQTGQQSEIQNPNQAELAGVKLPARSSVPLKDDTHSATATKSAEISVQISAANTISAKIDNDRVGIATDKVPGIFSRNRPDKTSEPQSEAHVSSALAEVSASAYASPLDVVPTKRQNQPAPQRFLLPATKAQPPASSQIKNTESEATVNITIGRLEIRATSQSPQSATPRSGPAAPLSLDAYLKAKAGNS
jgi:hypothetical protein